MNFLELINEKNQIIIPASAKEQLSQINKRQQNNPNFLKYCTELRSFFDITKKISITEESKRFFGGFILGEGSLNASLKKKSELLLGVALDIEFSVTQTIFHVSLLIDLIEVFHCGRFEFKSGSNATFVYKLSNRKTIEEKIYPFWESYICPYLTNQEKQRFKDFKLISKLFEKGFHKNKETFVNEILPVWDRLRKQKGQVNQSFATLQEAQNYILNLKKK